MDGVPDPAFGESLATDRWATASELLARRDELKLAGWDETDSESLPPIVRDLAAAASVCSFQFPGTAERLSRINEALDAGQVLPPHRCALLDPPANWPAAWREVLEHLNAVEPPKVVPHAPADSALNAAQSAVRGEAVASFEPDSSFRYAHSRSQSAAVEFIAAALAEDPGKVPSTVICSEDDDLASRLDACLHRIGLPTMGVVAWSRAHPVLQVLPLALSLCWRPVDPQLLLDFLAIPAGPIPRRAAMRLADALGEQPGLGSTGWEKIVAELCSEANDPDGKTRRRLDDWLYGERVTRGREIPARLVRERCGMVAQWATGRATLLAEDDSNNPAEVEAFRVAAGQAAMLGELAESQGKHLTEPQLARLIEEALASGVESEPFIEAEGGPTRVRSLAEIDAPYDRLVWLGLGTEDAQACRWSTHQLRQLQDAGIDIDDGSTALSAQRSSEARGFCRIRESFLAMLLPQDIEKRWHPIWLAVRGLLSEEHRDEPPVIDDLVAENNTDALIPFTFQTSEASVIPPQPARPLWEIPSELLRDRETVSASELESRLGCPLKWTFKYQAKLYPSSIAQLPDNFLLKGNFSHSIFEQVFGGGGELPGAEEAVAQVRQVFDERIGLDAAPLAQPDQLLERQRLRGELEHATRVLINTLAAGGYRIVELEAELSGQAFGKRLQGQIDCLAERDGEEAIIDFKYGGRTKYRRLIGEGKAVQLATYAYSRSSQNGRFPAVAYLVLSDGLFLTPSGSPVAGDGNRSEVDGPSIEAVWQAFSEALKNADQWVLDETPVPARPLQESDDWPNGTDLVLQSDLKEGEWQSVCRYCDYGQLCGIRGTS